MAITFHGSVSTFIAVGNNQLKQNLFVIENGYAARHNIRIRRMVLQVDTINVLTSVMPQVKISRMSVASTGGVILPKSSLIDTTETSDNALILKQTIYPGTNITATEGQPIWQEYGNRMHTGFSQILGDDSSFLPDLIKDVPLIMKPGENLLVQVVGAVVATNAGITTNWWLQVMWEEDSIAVFNISGVVTLSSTPVSGAKVLVLEADDEAGTNIRLVGIQTTDLNGLWASTIRSGAVGSAFVQYVSGGTYYTAPGSPYLES